MYLILSLVLPELDARVKHGLLTAHRTSTTRTYSSVQQRFLVFCGNHNLTPLPASELTILRFVAFLSSHLSPSSLPVYLSAIRALHILNFLDPPNISSPRIQLLLKSLYQNSPPAKQSLPITFNLMHAMYYRLGSDFDSLAAWACMTTCFFGCLRAGEVAPSREQAAEGLPIPSLRDLSFVSGSVPAALLRIHRTKTKTNGMLVVLGCSGHLVCAYCSLIKYLKARHIRTTTLHALWLMGM